jgi:Anti-sigma factor NepR
VVSAKSPAATPESGSLPKTTSASSPARTDSRDIGAALRAAYESALDEEIPAEMLDLLSKLN